MAVAQNANVLNAAELCALTTSAGEAVEKGEPSCTVGGNADGGGRYGRQHRASSKQGE